MTHFNRIIATLVLATLTGHGLAAQSAANGRPAQGSARPTTPSSPSTPSSQRTAQQPAAPATAPKGPPADAPAGITPPDDYVIGPEDVLVVIFWQDKDMSSEVSVRPDGKITLPLINDVQAAGQTPTKLRDKLEELGAKFLREPNATVVVKQINSRKVFITGQVTKPGSYALTAPTTVLQLIALSGGLLEYAKSSEIVVLRTENGKQVAHKFNYKEVAQQKNLNQNVELKPGDTVLVP